MKEYLERALSLKGFFVLFLALFTINTIRVNLPADHQSPRVLREKIVIRHMPRGNFIANWSYAQSSENLNFIEDSGKVKMRLENEQITFFANDGGMLDNWVEFSSDSGKYSFGKGILEIRVSSDFQIGSVSGTESISADIALTLRQNKEGDLTSAQVSMGKYNLELNDIKTEEEYLNTHHVAYFKEFYSFILFVTMSIAAVSFNAYIIDNKKIAAVFS